MGSALDRAHGLHVRTGVRRVGRAWSGAEGPADTPLGRRIARIVKDGEAWDRTDFYYSNRWQVLEERVADDVSTENKDTVATTVTVQVVWGARYIDAPVLRDRDDNSDGDCTDAGDEHLYYTQDANFNTTALVEPDGDVVERVLYDPYGQPTFYDGSWANPSATSAYDNEVLFCGYRFDAETSLYHVRRRMYHPTLGRWLQRDPLGYVDGLSLYQYCGSGPLGATDPMGQCADSAQKLVDDILGGNCGPQEAKERFDGLPPDQQEQARRKLGDAKRDGKFPPGRGAEGSRSVGGGGSDDEWWNWDVRDVKAILRQDPRGREALRILDENYTVYQMQPVSYHIQTYTDDTYTTPVGEPVPVVERGYHSRSRREIAIDGTTTALDAAATCIHETQHAKQHAAFEAERRRDRSATPPTRAAKEYDAFITTEKWRLDRGFPPERPEFRTTGPDGQQLLNREAIRRSVDRRYGTRRGTDLPYRRIGRREPRKRLVTGFGL